MSNEPTSFVGSSPTPGDGTVIFSRESGAWGSPSYDASEDVARVPATPVPHQERLGYSFDEPTADAVVLAMRWEKLRVPLAIGIDLGRTVLDHCKAQLCGLPRFG